MSPWKVIFATLVIFCSGLVTGALMAVKLHRAPAPHRVVTAAPAPPWHQQQRDFLKRIEGELTLTPEQRTRIEGIMKESQERTKQIRDRIAPELKEEVKRLRQEIRAELTPDQQKKFDDAVKPKPAKKSDDDGRRRKVQGTNAP